MRKNPDEIVIAKHFTRFITTPNRNIYYPVGDFNKQQMDCSSYEQRWMNVYINKISYDFVSFRCCFRFVLSSYHFLVHVSSMNIKLGKGNPSKQ